MVSNTLFSFLFALCVLTFTVAASNAHLDAHLDARGNYGYGYTTSTSIISSTRTVYRTVTVKKSTKPTSSCTTHSASVHKPTYASGAPYGMHNTTHASPTSVHSVGSAAPVPVTPVYSTGAAPPAKVTSNDAGRIGAWSGLIGVAAIVCASLF